MNGRVIKLDPRAVAVSFPDEATLEIALADGRRLGVPLSWSRRLCRATPQQRANVVFIAEGRYLSWPDVDEDIEVAAFLKAEEILEWPDDVALKRREDAASL